MKTCTVCKETKDEGEFYYNSATDTLMSMCCRCSSRFVTWSRRYKREGQKLTTREFRDKKLYMGVAQ